MLRFKSKIYTFYRRDDAMESDDRLDGKIGWSIIIVIRIVQSDTTSSESCGSCHPMRCTSTRKIRINTITHTTRPLLSCPSKTFVGMSKK